MTQEQKSKRPTLAEKMARDLSEEVGSKENPSGWDEPGSTKILPNSPTARSLAELSARHKYQQHSTKNPNKKE